jgi:hypothetical protein
MDGRAGVVQSARAMGIPIWAVALVLAATAPVIVRVVADAFAERARKRTEDALGSDRDE